VTPQPKAALYVRVSTGPQTEGTSLAGQLLVCRQKALAMGALVVGVFEDVQSGADYRDRAQLQAALALIERGEASLLIVAKLDRAGREVDALRDIKRRVERAGGELVFADGMEIQQNAVGDLMYTQLGAFAEYERAVIRERTVKGRRARAVEGQQPSRSMRPYGYDIVTKRHVMEGRFSLEQLGRYVVREEEAVWVRQIFERYAGGASLRGVQTWLTLEGPPSPRAGSQWAASTLRRLLQNSLYKGEGCFGRLQRLTDEKRIDRGVAKAYQRPTPLASRTQLIAPAIVAPELWAACQNALTTRRCQFSGRPSNRFLLSGLIICPVCARRLTARRVRSGKMVFPDGRAWPSGTVPDPADALTYWAYRRTAYIYQCPRFHDAVDKAKRCPGVRLHVGRTDADVLREVLLVAGNPARLEEYARAKAKTENVTTAEATAERKRLEADLATLDKRERAAIGAQLRAIEHDLDPSLYDETLRALNLAKRPLLERLSALNDAAPIHTPASSRAVAAHIAALLEKTRAVLEAPDDVVTPHEKNRLLHTVLERIEIEEPDGAKRLRLAWKGL